DTTDLVDRGDVALVELGDGFGDVLARFRQADADRATVDARALMVDEAEVDELLDVVGNVGAQVVTARAKFAGGQLGVADVEEEKCLDSVHIAATLTVELILDNVEQTAMKTFNKMKGFHVKITDTLFLLVTEVRYRLRLDFRIHDDCLTVLFGGV